MVEFNTSNLKKAVSLADVSKEIHVAGIAVKMATYHNDRYPEGRIPLNINSKSAMPVRDLRRLETFLREVWGSRLFIQLGFEQKQLMLYVYETDQL